MTKRIVMNLLADRPIAYHPDIARVAGGVKAGIFLSQLLYWSDKGKRADGYIWKTQEEWEAETALTRYEQEGARRDLKKAGLLDEKLQGIPAKLYYKPDTNILYQKLDELYAQSSMGKSNILEADNSPNSEGENSQSITESTKEYTESTPPAPEIVAYQNAFGAKINKEISDLFYDDIDEFGITAVIEVINEAKSKGKDNYKWVAAVLKGRASEGVQAKQHNDFWQIIEDYQQRRRAYKDLPANAQKAIKAIGGESVLRGARVGFELDQIKKQVMSYAQ